MGTTARGAERHADHCRSCGAGLRIEDLFCANCGAPVPEDAPGRERKPRVGARHGSGNGAAPWGEGDPWASPSRAGSGPDPAWWEEPLSRRSPERYAPSMGRDGLAVAPPSDSSRLWAAAAPLGIVAGAVFSLGLLSFVIPLLVWQLRKDVDPLAAGHGREALNAMLSLVVYGIAAVVVAVPVTLVTFGVGLLALFFAAGVVGLVFLASLLVATVRALDSRPFRYPLMIRFFRS